MVIMVMSVKDHVLMSKELCAILGSKAIFQWVLFVLISTVTSIDSS